MAKEKTVGSVAITKKQLLESSFVNVLPKENKNQLIGEKIFKNFQEF